MNKLKPFAAIFFFAAMAAYAAGNEGGHGGDPYALEFTTIAATLATDLATDQVQEPALFAKWGLSASRFSQAVSSVRVVSNEGDQVILRGQEVDAINRPELNQILINRTRWREDDLHARVQLVLHEYFGILGVERDSYTASIDFGAFVASETLRIDAQASQIAGDLFMANLFYGRCVSVPSLIDSSSCGQGSAALAQAESCARTQAEGKCRLSGKSQCELISTTDTTTLSSTVMGLRYCEVLVLMK